MPEFLVKLLEEVGEDVVLALIQRGITSHQEEGPYVDPSTRRQVRDILYPEGATKTKTEQAGERLSKAKAKRAAKSSKEG